MSLAPSRRPWRSSGLMLAWALALLSAGSAEAQQTASGLFGTGPYFQGYSLHQDLGIEAANLLMLPVAYEFGARERIRVDLYGAWARGQVESRGEVYQLSGLVDTRVRARIRARPWALVTLSANLPTGKSSHTGEEAVVASALASEMLGFREANWGMGTSVTSGLAGAWNVNGWGIGLGTSYRVSGDFRPEAGSDLVYGPGDELRFRFALDRNVGETGKVILGATFQRFASDEIDGRNLFQAGNRIRADAVYSFGMGRTTWTTYGANLWRARGDATLDIVGPDGQVVGDTTFHVGTQNVLVLGANGSVPLTGTYRVRPTFELRVQDREAGPGSGWLMGAGGDFPLRLMARYDVFPRAIVRLGEMEGPEGVRRRVWGGDLGLTVRWRP